MLTPREKLEKILGPIQERMPNRPMRSLEESREGMIGDFNLESQGNPLNDWSGMMFEYLLNVVPSGDSEGIDTFRSDIDPFKEMVLSKYGTLPVFYKRIFEMWDGRRQDKEDNQFILGHCSLNSGRTSETYITRRLLGDIGVASPFNESEFEETFPLVRDTFRTVTEGLVDEALGYRDSIGSNDFTDLQYYSTLNRIESDMGFCQDNPALEINPKIENLELVRDLVRQNPQRYREGEPSF
jgi:hypothetical protein